MTNVTPLTTTDVVICQRASRRAVLCAALMLVALIASACSSAPDVRERAWIGGVYTDWETPMTNAAAEQQRTRGILLVSSVEHAPSRKAGLLPGDVLTAINDTPVEEPDDLLACIEQVTPGERVVLHIVRGGRPMQVSCTTGMERYEKLGFVGIGLSFNPEIDLWPADDGMHILGMVGVRTRSTQPEYLHQDANNLESPIWGEPAARTMWRADLVILSFGREEHVLEQHATVQSK